jgi:hypothetical protein
METLEVVDGVTYKYERKPLEDVMPCTKGKTKYWFLWELVHGNWIYRGFFDTKAEMNNALGSWQDEGVIVQQKRW